MFSYLQRLPSSGSERHEHPPSSPDGSSLSPRTSLHVAFFSKGAQLLFFLHATRLHAHCLHAILCKCLIWIQLAPGQMQSKIIIINLHILRSFIQFRSNFMKKEDSIATWELGYWSVVQGPLQRHTHLRVSVNELFPSLQPSCAGPQLSAIDSNTITDV